MVETKKAPKSAKIDAACAAAVDTARAAAVAAASVFGVGEHLGVIAEGERVATHTFAVEHEGYAGWIWSVTVVRASRAKEVTVNEVVMLPGAAAHLAPAWVPWEERIEPGDLGPGVLLPSADNDPRLDPGFTGGEHAGDSDPVDASIERAVAAELGLGRERVLSDFGRGETAERWLAGEHGPESPMARQAPAPCAVCGFFVRLQGKLGALFGACTNVYVTTDGQVVAVDHGCGGHSDVVAAERGVELGLPVWDTVNLDNSLFD
ncbi:MAG: DUF3027 domain-containing protein [Propionibacteriaceae bacterium]